ncbi:hypothetical protein ACFX19_032511 [Malus domestica]
MYVASHLGDTLDVRLFLTSGMIGSGIFVALFGMGYFLNIHVFGFYHGMQMIAGLFEATGWPSIVAVIGAFIAVVGVLVFIFLAAYPGDIGSSFPPNSASNLEAVPDDEEANMKKEFMVNGKTKLFAELGLGDSRALATVTAIIDGTGSMQTREPLALSSRQMDEEHPM